MHINVEGDSSSNTVELGKVDHVIRIENPDAAVFSGTEQQIIDNLLNNGALDTLLLLLPGSGACYNQVIFDPLEEPYVR